MDRDPRRATINRALAARVGDNPTSSAIAEATLATWEEVAARLAPIIGNRGVQALFGRALYLTSISFPRLAPSGHHDAWSPSLERLGACLEAYDPAAAAAASHALLATFTELLTGLIGDSLAERLLGPVWTAAPPSSDPEITS